MWAGRALTLQPQILLQAAPNKPLQISRDASLTFKTLLQELGQALASFPSPIHTAEDGGHVDWEGADFAISDICDTLRLMRAEPSLLKCAPDSHDTRDS